MPLRHYTSVPFLLLAAANASCVPAYSQTHHVAPPETVTRAVGVYEWTGDLSKPKASRLVPVSLFINGHFEDAGLYMARPVPFALQSGDLYSIELAGDEKGTFSLERAADFTTGRLLPDQEPVGAWYGFGRFAPLTPPKLPTLHPSAHLPVIVASSKESSSKDSKDDSDRPHLTTKGDNGGKGAGDTSAKDSGSGSASRDSKDTDSTKDTSAATENASGKTPMGDDSDRPTLGRRTSSDSDNKLPDSTNSSSGNTDSTSSADSGSGGKSSTDNDPERPSLRKRNPENVGKKSPPTAGVTGPDKPLNDDPDRPIIRHGKKPEAEEDSELKTLPPDMHQVAAVSDPARRDPHVFARAWESGAERADILLRLQALARAQVAAYLAQNHLTPGSTPIPVAAPSSTKTAGSASSSSANSSLPDEHAPVLRRTPGGVNTSTSTSPAKAPTVPAPTASRSALPAKAGATTANGHRAGAAHPGRAAAAKPALPVPILLNAEQLTGYTLSYGGLPTFVYTAQVPTAEGPAIYVTLVVQRLPSGQIQLALHSVTDANHLDRTPWMRPVDAVDPDASHRASLLFELRAHDSRQFALYRLISAQAEQQFVSGAIQ